MSFFASRSGSSVTKPRMGPEHVTILMATHNGAAVIDAQLESLADQTHDDWSLIVSDDGSTDDTMDRVADFAARHPHRRIVRLRGPGQGSALNFLSLLRAAGATPYAAFCDQDDVWLPERLARGIAGLRGIETAAIHGGRTVITDAALNPLRLSPRFRKAPGFGNALVQNVAGGNTMLLNREALDLLQPASRSIRALVAHDWWAYQMVTATGGAMLWDPRPSVLYRQHAKNQIGANDTICASFTRARGLLSGRFSGWCRMQSEVLMDHRHRMTPAARAQLDALMSLRSRNAVARMIAFAKSGLYRQTTRGTWALWAAAILGRL